jgi:hypothetical protein
MSVPPESSSRTDRLIARVTRDIAQLDDVEREAFLKRRIENLQERHRRFIQSEGESEPCTDPANPIQASDFMLTLTALVALLRGRSA